VSAARTTRRAAVAVIGAAGASLLLLAGVARLVPEARPREHHRPPPVVTRVLHRPTSPPRTTVAAAARRSAEGVAAARVPVAAAPLPSLAEVGAAEIDLAALGPTGITGPPAFDPADLVLPPAAVPFTPPVQLDPVDPARFYPRRLRRRGIQGETRILLRVAADGAVSLERIERSTVGFEDAARRLARELRFVPARRGDQAVESLYPLTIKWRVR